MVPASNFCSTLNANVDNEKLTDAQFREFVRNSLPSVDFPRPVAAPVVPDNHPAIPTEPQKCKFCEYEWPGGEDHACEGGGGCDDDGNYYADYCGDQECPMCFSCQGNPATPERIAAAKEQRRIREKGSWLPKHPPQ